MNTTILYATVLCALCVSIAQASTIGLNTGNSPTPLEKLACSELRSYMGRMFTDNIKSVSGDADVIVGTPSGNPSLKKAIESGDIALPEGPNNDQGYTVKTIGKTTYIASSAPQGVLYGVYEFLEQYGAYFQISGERIPDPVKFSPKKIDITCSPVFKYRGVLPWDNFLCGMSGYDIEQYKELIDRCTRLKFNMLQFHFYNGMAFFTETVNGVTVDPVCIGMPIDVFKPKGCVGESVFKGASVFAPKPYIDNIGNPRAQAEAVQEMMRKVLDYAKSRGWKTVVGHELMFPLAGNPTMTDKPQDGNGGDNVANPLDPHNAEISVERFRSLVKTYPNSDYYWLWQSEGRGTLSRNIGREPGAAEMREKYAYWTEVGFVAGDIDYAYLFREVAKRLTPEERSKLATGGWSIDHIFPGINKDMPSEVIFASLNFYDLPYALETQAARYRVAKDGRRAWMIEWWEFDGEQWFPQFRVGRQEHIYRKCVDYGVESVTLLGWKLSGIEHNVRFLSEFSWNPHLTAEQFYTNYTKKLIGAPAAPLAAHLMEYDEMAPRIPGACPGDPRNMLLGAGWASIVIPVFPDAKTDLDTEPWKTIVTQAKGDLCGISGQEKLAEMDRKTIETLKKSLPQLDKQGRFWADLLINRLEFRRIFIQSTISINKAIITYDEVGRSGDTAKARAAAAVQAQKAVDYARRAIEKYAQVIRNRGDQGVIAQLNEQHYRPIAGFARSLKNSGASNASVDWSAFRINPRIKFDFANTSAWSYRDGKVEIMPSDFNGKPALKLIVGGNNIQFNSAHIHPDPINLNTSPYLDFRIRTTTKHPLALLFQVKDDSFTWYCLNLVGRQQLFKTLESIPGGSINDGQWHRITWNLREVCKDYIETSVDSINNLIIGSWTASEIPTEAEFADFTLGTRNVMD